jgi:hypothetical protein
MFIAIDFRKGLEVHLQKVLEKVNPLNDGKKIPFFMAEYPIYI